MGEKRMDPKQQFSKWLAKSGAIYWIAFHTLLLAVMCFRPETAMACVYLAIIVSVVMIIHVMAYTRNSIYEKMLLAMIDKTNLELSLKPTKISTVADDTTDNTEGEGDYDG